jgi:hypothetical protein
MKYWRKPWVGSPKGSLWVDQRNSMKPFKWHNNIYQFNETIIALSIERTTELLVHWRTFGFGKKIVETKTSIKCCTKLMAVQWIWFG